MSIKLLLDYLSGKFVFVNDDLGATTPVTDNGGWGLLLALKNNEEAGSAGSDVGLLLALRNLE